MSETHGPAGIIVAQAATPGTLPVESGVEIAVPAGEAHGSNFPPFDVHTFPSQLLWLVIAFAALYLLMSRVALPRIATILEERHDRIADDIEEAGKLKAESEAAAEAYEKALASARNKAHGIATETRDTLAAEAEARRKALEAELNVKLAAAEVQIAATKTAAMANVRGIAVEAAGAIVNTLIGTTPAPGAVEEAVDTAIKG
ncbi:F0F1 ATP synthase subunit B [Ancylobacter sp.]|uniref:F0F1 ATP synthase subunit B n=1 Tax=Ancylobacter sp. TaxID=1872567 RepID=UPI003D1403F6